MLVCIALRFYYVSVDGADSTLIFLIILSFYQVIFIGLLVAAEFKKEKPRLYFDFLDDKFGRGCLIIFLMLLIFENNKWVIVILGVVVLAIGLIGIIAGWSQPRDGNPS
jgi:hypothetical protein